MMTIDVNIQNIVPLIWFASQSKIKDMETPLNPEQIAEYIHEEHTPYSQMSLEDSKKHLAELIQRYADEFASDKIASLREPEFE